MGNNLPIVGEQNIISSYTHSAYRKTGDLKSRGSDRSKLVNLAGQNTQVSTNIESFINKNAPLRQSKGEQNWKPGGNNA